jgi:TRAP-type C4-dicarboxylate transport system permease small subunit
LDRFIERLARVLTLALALAFVGAVALNFVNVVGRYVFATAILGADEVQVFIMVWMTFAGAAIVTWRNQHLRMDVLFDLLPARARRWIRLVEVVLMAVIAGFVVVQSVRFAALMVSVDRRSEAANIPMVIPHSAVVLGFTLMALLALVKLARLARGTEEKSIDH